MFSSRSVWFLLPLLLASSVGYGVNVQVKWTGAKSALWNDAGNWENGIMPSVGDFVTLSARADQPVLTNDMEDVSVKQLVFSGDYPVTLAGNPIKLTRYSPLDNSCVVTSAVPITVDSGNDLPQFNLSKPIVFTAPFVSRPGLRLYFAATKVSVDFLDTVTIENGLLLGSGSSATVNFHKPVDLYGFVNGVGHDFNVCFYAAGNCWTTNSQAYYGFTQAAVANAFPTNMVMRWERSKNSETENDARFLYSLSGDQTIDRIESVAPTGTAGSRLNVYHVNTGREPLTLTLRGTADAVAYAELMGKLSLVWDPVGDFTQEFCGMAHRMSGTIAVKGGTLASAEGNSFPNVTGLTVANGAVFSASADVAKPFADNQVHIVVGRLGKLALGAGVSIVAASLCHNGVWLPAGTYTGVGFGSEGLVETPWIEGAGRVTVADQGFVSWKEPVSGLWSVGGNWAAGAVPTSGDDVSVMAGGADYTVRLDATSETMPATLELGSDDGHASELEVSTDLSFQNTDVTLADGARLAFVAGSPAIDWTKIKPAAGATDAVVTFRDNVVWNFDSMSGNLIRLGGAAGRIVCNFENQAMPKPGDMWVYQALIGYDAGEAVLNITNCYFDTQAVGLRVGSPKMQGGFGLTTGVRGIVNVWNGGTLRAEGQGACMSPGWSDSNVNGITVGYGLYTAVTSGRPYVGELNVFPGGLVKDMVGDVAVGVGHGQGTCVIDGGTMQVNDMTDASRTVATNRTFALGLGGGSGSLTVKNGGSLVVACNGFLGGADKARFPLAVSYLVSARGYLDSGSEGMLSVLDGSATFELGLTLSHDGPAEVRIVGKSGSLSAKSLTVENGGPSTFRYTLDETGVAPIVVAETTSLGTQAKLVVDMSAYGKASRVRLITCPEIAGDFATVELIGADSEWRVVRDATGISVAKPRGMMMILR